MPAFAGPASWPGPRARRGRGCGLCVGGGVGGAVLCYSGNLVGIGARRKRRQQGQGGAEVNMARATGGICSGFGVAVSAAVVAAQVFEARAPARVDAGIRWTCFVAWAACATWAAVRTPARAARELLWLAAAVTVAIPLTHGLATGMWPWTRSEEHTSELQSLMRISYAVFCLKK